MRSSGDRALALSKRFHDFPRAGESGENLLTLPGVDTIDATAVDTSFLGHSYFADNRVLLHDMFDLIRYEAPPDHRLIWSD